MEKTKKTREIYDDFKLGVYILKGGDRVNPRTSFIKYNRGFSNEFVDEAISLWKDNIKAEVKTNDKVKKDSQESKTHYALIKEIYSKANKTTRLVRDEFGNLVSENCIENSVATWHLMCKILNDNSIRTSSHELERFYVTLLRQDPLHQEDLYFNLMRKLNSKHTV